VLVSFSGFIGPHLIVRLSLIQVILFISNQLSFDWLFSPFLRLFFVKVRLICKHNRDRPLP